MIEPERAGCQCSIAQPSASFLNTDPRNLLRGNPEKARREITLCGDWGAKKYKAEVHGNRTDSTTALTGKDLRQPPYQFGPESGPLQSEMGQFPADLKVVVNAWPQLPDRDRGAIAAIVRNAIISAEK